MGKIGLIAHFVVLMSTSGSGDTGLPTLNLNALVPQLTAAKPDSLAGLDEAVKKAQETLTVKRNEAVKYLLDLQSQLTGQGQQTVDSNKADISTFISAIPTVLPPSDALSDVLNQVAKNRQNAYSELGKTTGTAISKTKDVMLQPIADWGKGIADVFKQNRLLQSADSSANPLSSLLSGTAPNPLSALSQQTAVNPFSGGFAAPNLGAGLPNLGQAASAVSDSLSSSLSNLGNLANLKLPSSADFAKAISDQNAKLEELIRTAQLVDTLKALPNELPNLQAMLSNTPGLIRTLLSIQPEPQVMTIPEGADQLDLEKIRAIIQQKANEIKNIDDQSERLAAMKATLDKSKMPSSLIPNPALVSQAAAVPELEALKNAFVKKADEAAAANPQYAENIGSLKAAFEKKVASMSNSVMERGSDVSGVAAVNRASPQPAFDLEGLRQSLRGSSDGGASLQGIPIEGNYNGIIDGLRKRSSINSINNLTTSSNNSTSSNQLLLNSQSPVLNGAEPNLLLSSPTSAGPSRMISDVDSSSSPVMEGEDIEDLRDMINTLYSKYNTSPNPSTPATVSDLNHPRGGEQPLQSVYDKVSGLNNKVGSAMGQTAAALISGAIAPYASIGKGMVEGFRKQTVGGDSSSTGGGLGVNLREFIPQVINGQLGRRQLGDDGVPMMGLQDILGLLLNPTVVPLIPSINLSAPSSSGVLSNLFPNSSAVPQSGGNSTSMNLVGLDTILQLANTTSGSSLSEWFPSIDDLGTSSSGSLSDLDLFSNLYSAVSTPAPQALETPGCMTYNVSYSGRFLYAFNNIGSPTECQRQCQLYSSPVASCAPAIPCLGISYSLVTRRCLLFFHIDKVAHIVDHSVSGPVSCKDSSTPYYQVASQFLCLSTNATAGPVKYVLDSDRRSPPKEAPAPVFVLPNVTAAEPSKGAGFMWAHNPAIPKSLSRVVKSKVMYQVGVGHLGFGDVYWGSTSGVHDWRHCQLICNKFGELCHFWTYRFDGNLQAGLEGACFLATSQTPTGVLEETYDDFDVGSISGTRLLNTDLPSDLFGDYGTRDKVRVLLEDNDTTTTTTTELSHHNVSPVVVNAVGKCNEYGYVYYSPNVQSEGLEISSRTTTPNVLSVTSLDGCRRQCQLMNTNGTVNCVGFQFFPMWAFEYARSLIVEGTECLLFSSAGNGSMLPSIPWTVSGSVLGCLPPLTEDEVTGNATSSSGNGTMVVPPVVMDKEMEVVAEYKCEDAEGEQHELGTKVSFRGVLVSSSSAQVNDTSAATIPNVYYNVNTPLSCMKHCESEKKCVGFSWVTSRVCMLMGSVDGYEYDPKVVSGFAVCERNSEKLWDTIVSDTSHRNEESGNRKVLSCSKYNLDTSFMPTSGGLIITNQAVNSSQLCFNTCRKTRACSFFTYSGSTAECSLFRQVIPDQLVSKSPLENVVSLSAQCDITGYPMFADGEEPDDSSAGELSSGAVVGIALGASIGATGLIGIGALIFKKKGPASDEDGSTAGMQHDETTPQTRAAHQHHSFLTLLGVNTRTWSFAKTPGLHSEGDHHHLHGRSPVTDAIESDEDI